VSRIQFKPLSSFVFISSSNVSYTVYCFLSLRIYLGIFWTMEFELTRQTTLGSLPRFPLLHSSNFLILCQSKASYSLLSWLLDLSSWRTFLGITHHFFIKFLCFVFVRFVRWKLWKLSPSFSHRNGAQLEFLVSHLLQDSSSSGIIFQYLSVKNSSYF